MATEPLHASDSSAPPPPPASHGRWRFVATALLVYGVHLLLVAYACPREVIFGGEPIMGIDYQTHYEQTSTVIRALSEFGRTWAYDPHLLAGQPAGLFFDVDNKLHCYFTFLLTCAGVDRATAFNLFVVLVHLLAPLLVWAAASVLRTGRVAALCSFGLAVLVWHFDSAPRWYWWAGMISFALASLLAVLVVALFHRLLDAWRWPHLVGVGLLLPLCLMAHVWGFAILVVPLSAMYVRRARRGMGASQHARVWGIALFALAVNLFWLYPALLRLDLLAGSGRGGQATPLTVLTDYLELFVDGLIAGTIATRTFFRFAALCGAAVTLWLWRRALDPRLFAAGVTQGWTLGMAYVFALLPFIEETEPYRFIWPATITAVILCGPALAPLLSRAWLAALSPRARVLLVVLLILVVPRPLQTVLYFVPELDPRNREPIIPQPNIEGPRALVPVDRFFSFRHNGIPSDYRELRDYLGKECPEPGRVLVQWWVMGEYLRWATDKPIIGGFPDRRMKHEAANIFRYVEDSRHHGKALADYLVRYNVRYVVMSFIRPHIEQRRDLLEFKRLLGSHRVYRVRHLANDFVSGTGTVKADLNRIELSDLKPPPGRQDVVIRYHHLDALRCKPDCRVERFPIPLDPVGFIRVTGTPTLASRVTVYNGY